MVDDQTRSEIVNNSADSLFFNAKFAVIVGMETHVAVWQTCRDLLALGIMPVVLAGGVCSRNRLDTDVCLKKMKECGMVVTTLEAWIHEYLSGGEHEAFQDIYNLCQDPVVLQWFRFQMSR